jgi:uncharacterized protein (DUF58 family)
MTTVLSAGESNQLDRLTLAALSAAAPAAGGATHLPAPGSGLDFHDYRHYQPGDDPRSIDWTIAARHQQLVVRRFRAEGHTPLHLLLDTSGSMALGSPAKLSCAAKLAAALGYVAASRRDAVGLTTFDTAVRSLVPIRSGRAQLHRMLHALGAAAAGGPSSLDKALTMFGSTVSGPGLVVVLSDFFEPELTLDGVRYLLYRGLTPALVQVLADDEIAPELDGDLDLVDAERPDAPPVPVNAASADAYRRQIDALEVRLQNFCAEHVLPWLRVTSSLSFDALVTAAIRAGLFAAC